MYDVRDFEGTRRNRTKQGGESCILTKAQARQAKKAAAVQPAEGGAIPTCP